MNDEIEEKVMEDNKVKACDCSTWADDDFRLQMIGNGHHRNCQHYKPDVAIYDLLLNLIKGIKWWADQEDGVPDEVFEAYSKAKEIVSGKGAFSYPASAPTPPSPVDEQNKPKMAGEGVTVPTQKLYATRDVEDQGYDYYKHVEAMTAEQLHHKSDIAAELAHRDILLAAAVRERDSLKLHFNNAIAAAGGLQSIEQSLSAKVAEIASDRDTALQQLAASADENQKLREEVARLRDAAATKYSHHVSRGWMASDSRRGGG